MMNVDQFGAALRNHGLKATPQRVAVHEAMMELVHAGADTVARYVRGKMGRDITVVSVYNILTLLSSLGIYGRRMSMNNKMYFDIEPKRHIHLYDTVLSDYRDIPDDGILSVVENHFKGRRFRGHSVDGVEIQLLCHPTRRVAGKKKKS